MASLANQPSIVVVGAWNPAILQPHWLAKEVYEIPEGQEFPATMAFSTDPGAPPKCSIGGISYIASSDRLTVFVEGTEQANLEEAGQRTGSILRSLSHTPVSAMGQNFEFKIEAPSQDLLNVFEINDDLISRVPEAYALQGTSIQSTLRLESGILNLTRAFDVSNGVAYIKFNFHNDLGSAEDAATKLESSFWTNYQIADEILKSYDTVLAED